MLLAAVGAQAGFVTIGDPGNIADTNGMGAVDYTYGIGEHEVTIAEFAASGAGNGNENVWEVEAGTNAPAGNVSFYEMAKYCNWLTSGTTNKGPYSFDYQGSFKGVNRASAFATYGTIYVVPNTNEWYKAAYYNTVTHSYSSYANGTATAPSGTDANYNNAVGTPWSVGSGTIEQNGTYDMAGNVWELMEYPAGRYYGGYYAGGAFQLLSTYGGQAWGSGSENSAVGFRVAEIVADPESVGWVKIGDPGNAADTNGLGSVDYTFEIGVHEVTIAEFAASGAGNGNENAWESIEGTNAPAVNLSFYESARYCNWLTSGSTNNGAYLFAADGDYLGVDRDAALANYGTIYVIPTTDEWYKAAYYSVANHNYTRYANGTASAPSGFSARYGRTSDSPDYHPWAVGSGLVAEQNGTRDMAGNVWERVEDDPRIYGGSYAGGVHQLRSEYAGIAWDQWTETNTSVGMRVVRITPDPSSHYPSTIISISHVSGDVFKMVVACPTPETSYPKVRSNLAIGSWGSVGHSTSSSGPFTTNNLGTVAGTNTIYVESSTATAFFGIGEK